MRGSGREGRGLGRVIWVGWGILMGSVRYGWNGMYGEASGYTIYNYFLYIIIVIIGRGVPLKRSSTGLES